MFSSNATQVSSANYIEDVFSTYLYTGNNSIPGPTITNGVDLSGKGGMVWFKSRSGVRNNAIYDTIRGTGSVLYTDLTNAAGSVANSIQYNSDGFQIKDSYTYYNAVENYVSWTFRKQPKFFDVVTYTGNGTGQTINHNLGSVPGCIIIKATGGGASSGVTNWAVYHRSLGNTDFAWLNSTAAKQTSSGYWNNTTPTSTQFTVGSTGNVNESGASFVAYVFAHDAGGFGLTGTDNVISCGSCLGGTTEVNLGFEPQWILFKNITDGGPWFMVDNMRGMAVDNAAYNGDQTLYSNTAGAELSNGVLDPTSTGFKLTYTYSSSATLIYIAIRRGPMKVPTSGTSVFSPSFIATSGAPRFTSNAPVDAVIYRYPRASTAANQMGTRLLQGTYLVTNTAAAEDTGGGAFKFDYQTGSMTSFGASSTNVIGEQFSRAPSVFDVVCYTGTGSARTISHNLGVAPELMIVKDRKTAATVWLVYSAYVTNPAGNRLVLNDVFAANVNNSIFWNNTAPTSTVFSLGTYQDVNLNTDTYVAYLFATCAGVSKVGSYTGTGTTLQVNCGFTAGSRFVLIKRTDSTGDWYVWDSARGIVAGNDPYFLLNSTAAEVTSTDYVDTYSAGFEISSTAPAAINASGGTFIFFAVA